MTLPKRLIVLVALVVALGSACGDTASDEGTRTDLTLRPDGIGPYIVGQPADEIIESLSGSIGGPNGDSEEPGSLLEGQDCDGVEARVVSWGSLVLYFVDRSGSSVFETWSYGFDPITGNADDARQLGLATEEGVGLGTPREDLIDAYGLRLQFDDNPGIDLSIFTIDGTRSEHLAGRMTTTEADSEVQFLERRPACEIPELS